jgi:ribonucleoside-diphosphate reductase alpha chain
MQSTLTNFHGLRDVWQYNTVQERLLGVSLTGIMDSNLTNGEAPNLDDRLAILRDVAINTNGHFASALGVQASASVTCVKPSGTVSQLVDAASGIHPRHAKYYIRTVRGDNKDPLTNFLRDAGVPTEPCVMKPNDTSVFSFPMKSPPGAITGAGLSAIKHLNLWKKYQDFWCTHKPSVTISYSDDEYPDIVAWVWRHFGSISGISFLPRSDHTYQQAPYQTCTEAEYEAMLARMPAKIDWSKLAEYETEDATKGSQEFACTANGCEITEI